MPDPERIVFRPGLCDPELHERGPVRVAPAQKYRPRQTDLKEPHCTDEGEWERDQKALDHPMKKLILFDIDGTLLSTRGAARKAFTRAMLEVYGTTGPIATHTFNGKTDPQIARELLRLDGMPDDRIDAGLPALWDRYLAELRIEVAAPGHQTEVMPGVPALLNALAHEHQDCLVALLTGNIVGGAAVKLQSAGLEGYFAFGAYGSDCERRDGLPPIAVERAFVHAQRRFLGREVIVIGDTPSDVTCGRSIDVFAFAVETGGHGAEELEAAGAHAVLPDLSDTARVLDILLS